MLFKVISLIISYWMGRFNVSHGSEVNIFTNATLGHVRKTIMMLIGALGGLVVLLGGFFTVLIDMILTTRSAGQLSFSQASIVGSALIVISLLLQWSVFRRPNWQLPTAQAAPVEPPPMHPIAEALLALIQDYAQERKADRAAANSAASASVPPADSAARAASSNPAFN